ncbi:MAG: sigma-70 family RNA polymerase sigma factor [Cyclobacteriaceae bacterium]
MNSSAHLDHLYKKLFVKMVAGLMKKFEIKDITVAEDAVQDTFLAAQTQWPNKLPDNPEAWLFRVCRNIAVKGRRPTDINLDEIDQQSDSTFFEEESEPIDKGFWMLVACANPRFSPKQQVIFALRYAAGFKVEQIAILLGTPRETITKTLQRLRKIVKDENIDFYSEETTISEPSQNAVLMVLYLMFSEGYKTSRGKSLLNIELCEDALAFTQIFVKNEKLVNPDAKALYALMLFNLSRFEARFTIEGELIDLENQDRSCWNVKMIGVAVRYLNEAKTQILSRYHIEAAIAFLHCSASSFATTEWHKIVSLYEQLRSLNESPFVLLNLAIAKFYANDIKEAFSMMVSLGEIAFINRYHLYHVAMGKMYSRMEDLSKAKLHFTKAITLTDNQIEKRYIQKLQDKLDD